MSAFCRLFGEDLTRKRPEKICKEKQILGCAKIDNIRGARKLKGSKIKGARKLRALRYPKIHWKVWKFLPEIV